MGLTICDILQRGSNITRTLHGSGLGLASVRRIIEQHGGSIQVQSEEHVGSTFTLWLPLEDAESATQYG